jgi:hypothetical protein
MLCGSLPFSAVAPSGLQDTFKTPKEQQKAGEKKILFINGDPESQLVKCQGLLLLWP